MFVYPVVLDRIPLPSRVVFVTTVSNTTPLSCLISVIALIMPAHQLSLPSIRFVCYLCQFLIFSMLLHCKQFKFPAIACMYNNIVRHQTGYYMIAIRGFVAYNWFVFYSTEARLLLRSVMQWDPLKRPTIPAIAMEPWMTGRKLHPGERLYREQV